jgi:hypothetical protein
VRLKSLQRAIREDILASPSKSFAADSSAGPAEWRAFVSRKNLSSRDLKTCLAKMRRSAGPAECVGIVVEWALSTPRAGNIGAGIGFLPETPPCTSCAEPRCSPCAGSQSPSKPHCPQFFFPLRGRQPQSHSRSS